MAAMKIALIQQRATRDKQQNIARGLANLEAAARNEALRLRQKTAPVPSHREW